MTARFEDPEEGGGSIRKQVPEDSLLAILKVASSRTERGGFERSASPAAREAETDICKRQAERAANVEKMHDAQRGRAATKGLSLN